VRKPRTLSPTELVDLASTLPEVVLRESVNWTSITFNGRGFAWVDHRDDRVTIKARHEERAALLAIAPATYAAGWESGSTAWVRVRLELADRDEVAELLEDAWRMTATKRAIRAYDRARGR